MISPIITINPQFPIGTEIYFLQNNKIETGLIAAYNVHVTSATEENKSWHRQLWDRWHNKKAKDIWKYSFDYEVKLDTDIRCFRLSQLGGHFYIWGTTKIYFDIEQLKKSL